MTIQDVARSEGISERQAQRYCSVGFKGHILKATKSGRSFCIELDDYKAWRIACGFDTPSAQPAEGSAVGPKPSESVSLELPHTVAVPTYPPWPQAADPNGVLTNQPHEHSRNWPHPLAQQDHEREMTRKAMEQWRGYPDDNE